MTEKKTEREESFESLSFKEASQELEGIIRELETNQLELEDSLRAYEQGIKLVKTLKSRLSDAEQKVQTLLGEIEPEVNEGIDEQLS
ncbi:MAG: exodeoxyribonuclease VII small subunit [Coriobacteriia bacterium]|nr:exodeoxyribonuclease VII small subunit [Coriobacteriia bacterium]